MVNYVGEKFKLSAALLPIRWYHMVCFQIPQIQEIIEIVNVVQI